MHHDEANQAIKFGDLLERGDYRYDYRDHHGPTLYYLTLPSAWLGGQQTLASLDEVTLRARAGRLRRGDASCCSRCSRSASAGRRRPPPRC